MTETERPWFEDREELIGLARALDSACNFENEKAVIDFFAWPWKFTPEYHAWVGENRPDEFDYAAWTIDRANAEERDAARYYVCGTKAGSHNQGDYFSDRRTDSGPVDGRPGETWGDVALVLCGGCAKSGEAMSDADAFDFYARGIQWIGTPMYERAQARRCAIARPRRREGEAR